LSRAQRVVAYLMVAAYGVAALIGFWPVYANVFGDPSYYCGSGFIHHQHHWVVDSKAMANERFGGEDTATGNPRRVCPDKILNNRDLALLIAAFTTVVGVLALGLLNQPQDRSTQAISASMRLRRSTR
jgi:hypothetical protein